MGVDDAQMVHITRGVLLHDIGKMAIPDGILLKPGALTEEERELIKQHPKYAYNMLKTIDFLRPAIDIPHYHHEKWDGTGYPDGLKGEEIPFAARIFPVVDVWDALTSNRPYRNGLPHEEVKERIKADAGNTLRPEGCGGVSRNGGLFGVKQNSEVCADFRVLLYIPSRFPASRAEICSGSLTGSALGQRLEEQPAVLVGQHPAICDYSLPWI